MAAVMYNETQLMLHPIDIITRDGRLTGQTSDPNEANNKGLWHQGIHVLLYTPDGRVLIQKRSRQILQYPGKIDLGVGGFVDAGETPEQAVLREVHEETGIHIGHDQLRLVGTSHYNHRWKLDGRPKINRSYVYSFVCRLHNDQLHTLHPQPDEVEWLRFIPFRSAEWLVRHHSLKRFGQLVGSYAYYSNLLSVAKIDYRQNLL